MPKKFQPVAFIFTDNIPNRFITSYATVLYEEFSIVDLSKVDIKSLPNHRNVAEAVQFSEIQTPKSKVFVIYSPVKQKLLLAQMAEVDSLKVLIDSLDKQKLLAAYAKSFKQLSKLSYILDVFEDEFHLLKAPPLSKSQQYVKNRKDVFQSRVDAEINVGKIREQLINKFKKDLCF